MTAPVASGRAGLATSCQRVQRPRAGDAVGQQALALLEGEHRRLGAAAEGAVDQAGIEALVEQRLLQTRHRGAGHASLENLHQQLLEVARWNCASAGQPGAVAVSARRVRSASPSILSSIALRAVRAQRRALDPAVEDQRHRARGRRQGRREGLEALRDLEPAAGRAPRALHRRRHDPEVDARDLLLADRLVGHVDGEGAVGQPVAHVPVVGDDPGARRQRQQARPQLQVDGGQQVHRHHAGAAEVGGEQVLLAELDPLLHAGDARQLAALLHQLRHDLDAEAARAEAAGRGDDDAAVAGAEVDHVIGRADGGELEHRQRHLVGRGDERHLVLRRRRRGRGEQADRQAERAQRRRQDATRAPHAGPSVNASCTADCTAPPSTAPPPAT